MSLRTGRVIIAKNIKLDKSYKDVLDYSETIGYSTLSNKSTPASSMEVINNIFRKGVTIWYTHSDLGNYDLDNSINSNG